MKNILIVLTLFTSCAFAIDSKIEPHKIDDKEYMQLIVQNDWKMVEFATDGLKNDKEFILNGSKTKNNHILRFASDELKNNPQLMLELINNGNGEQIIYATDEIRNNKEIILKLVERNGSFIEYASDGLKDDEEVIMKALETNRVAFLYASDRLKQDDKVVIEALHGKKGFYLLLLDDHYKDDPVVINKIIRLFGKDAVVGASDLMKRKYHIKNITHKRTLLSIIEDQNKHITSSDFKYLSESLSDDDEIIYAALKEDPMAFAFASKRLKNDINVVGFALEQSKKIDFLLYTTNLFRNTKENALKIVEKNGMILKYLGYSMRNDVDVVKIAIKENAQAFLYASTEVKNNPDVAKLAIEQDPKNTTLVSSRTLKMLGLK